MMLAVALKLGEVRKKSTKNNTSNQLTSCASYGAQSASGVANDVVVDCEHEAGQSGACGDDAKGAGVSHLLWVLATPTSQHQSHIVAQMTRRGRHLNSKKHDSR